MSGDYVYGGYPKGSYPGDRYPGSNYPGSGYGNSTVRCESKDRRTRHCNIDTRGGVRLTRRLSDASCVQGRSWGYDSRGVWVSNGCRAEFVSGGGNYGPAYGNRPGDNYYGQTVRCESNDRRPRRCNVSVRRGVDIVRPLSKTTRDRERLQGGKRGSVRSH